MRRPLALALVVLVAPARAQDEKKPLTEELVFQEAKFDDARDQVAEIRFKEKSLKVSTDAATRKKVTAVALLLRAKDDVVVTLEDGVVVAVEKKAKNKAVVVGALAFDKPDWKAAENKAGRMGPKKEWTLEKAEGDDEAPSVKLYYFDGQGGTLDDNLKRWCGQFTTKDGDAISPDDVKKESFKTGGVAVTLVEIAGTYTRPPMMGGGDPKPGQKLIAAYIDGEGGPWFVKLQGAEKSVAKAKDAFVKWLKTAKLGPKAE